MESLHEEMGWRRAEAFVEGLLGTIEYLDSLRDVNGNPKEINLQDLELALKRNFGTEWSDAYERILEKNGGEEALLQSIEEFYKRGESLGRESDFSVFLNSFFPETFKRDGPKIERIALAKFIPLGGSKLIEWFRTYIWHQSQIDDFL